MAASTVFREQKKTWTKRETEHVRFELLFAHRTTVMRGKQRVLIQTTKEKNQNGFDENKIETLLDSNCEYVWVYKNST